MVVHKVFHKFDSYTLIGRQLGWHLPKSNHEVWLPGIVTLRIAWRVIHSEEKLKLVTLPAKVHWHRPKESSRVGTRQTPIATALLGQLLGSPAIITWKPNPHLRVDFLTSTRRDVGPWQCWEWSFRVALRALLEIDLWDILYCWYVLPGTPLLLY